jgi:Lar family restriction alleviation protein
MMTDLKPCPFCGSKPYLYRNDPYMDDRRHNRVHCKNCGVDGPHDEWFKLNGVIKAWNSRTPLEDAPEPCSCPTVRSPGIIICGTCGGEVV